MRGTFALFLLAGCSAANPSAPDSGAPDDASAQEADVDAGPPLVSASADSIMETEPTIAVAPDGSLATAWLAASKTSMFVGASYSADRGATWSSPSKIAMPSGRIPSNEILATDSKGNFWLGALGVKSDYSASSAYVAKAPPGGVAFGSFVEASDSAASAIRDATSLVVASDDSLTVVYTEYGPSTSWIVVAHSADGATWTRTTISSTTGSNAWPNLCASRTSARVAAVYLDDTGGISIRWSTDNGVTWLPQNANSIMFASVDQYPGEFPSCVLQGTDMWIVQGIASKPPSQSYAPAEDQIWLLQSTGGSQFTDRGYVQDVSAGTKFMRPMAAVENDGSLSLVYYAGAAENDKAATVRRSRSTNGMSFLPSTEVYSPITLSTSRTGTNWLGDMLGTTADAQGVYVTFVDNASGAAHVRFARLTL